jgi:hypothetical protein
MVGNWKVFFWTDSGLNPPFTFFWYFIECFDLSNGVILVFSTGLISYLGA